MAAVLGGTQSLHTNAKDEALALPTEEAARTALRTQQVIAYESGIADTVDPLAGSYYVEYLTDELEKKSLELIAQIDALGGAVKAIEAGFYQDRIASSAFDFQKKVDAKEEVVVGVNEFMEDETSEPDTLKIDPKLEAEQKGRVAALRARRDAKASAKALAEVKQAATSGENLMPRIISAVENYATLGEIADSMRFWRIQRVILAENHLHQSRSISEKTPSIFSRLTSSSLSCSSGSVPLIVRSARSATKLNCLTCSLNLSFAYSGAPPVVIMNCQSLDSKSKSSRAACFITRSRKTFALLARYFFRSSAKRSSAG
jgi:hypothetical protein